VSQSLRAERTDEHVEHADEHADEPGASDPSTWTNPRRYAAC